MKLSSAVLALSLALTFGLSSCGDDPAEETPIFKNPCNPNPCAGANKSVCAAVNNAAVCSCDEGYVDDNGSCVPERVECASGTCTPSANGDLCLEGGNIPDAAPLCDLATGAGCPDGFLPFTANDGTNDICVCIETCGDCPAGTACELISGREACLVDGQVPPGATTCDPTTGAGCATGQFPAGDGTNCFCLDWC